jgi:hypothetical protein
MGKNRNQRRRNARFAQVSQQQYIDGILAEEQGKKNHKEYMEGVNKMRDERLTRTVYANNVRNLNQDVNLHSLRSFMEVTFGPVEICVKEKPWGKPRGGRPPFPRARIMFRSASDAQKVFGGTPLINVSEPVLVPCSVGCKGGNITVLAPRRYHGPSSGDDLLQGESISFDAKSLALGHWCPDDADMYWNATDDECTATEEEWVQEICLKQTCQLRIDLLERKIEISTPYTTESTSTSDDGLDGFARFFADIGFGGKPTSSVLSFRFKSLCNHIEICREKGDTQQFSLIFVLKHAPRIENDVANVGLLGSSEEESERVRCTSFPGIEREFFGRCRGFKLALNEANLLQLTRHAKFSRLFDFGLLRSVFRSHQYVILSDDAGIRYLRTKELTSYERRLRLERYNRCMKDLHDVDDRAGKST